jgi:hypothetical protein
VVSEEKVVGLVENDDDEEGAWFSRNPEDSAAQGGGPLVMTPRDPATSIFDFLEDRDRSSQGLMPVTLPFLFKI